MYWDLTSSGVLTMEYCEGGKINDFDYMTKKNINCKEVSPKRLTKQSIYVKTLGHMEVRDTLQ